MNEQSLQLSDMTFDQIEVGYTFGFEKVIDAELVETFANLSGDHNPLHMDDAYAKETTFGGRIAHGMLLSSFFSTLVGMLCPGKRCLYLSQDLQFKNPLSVGSTVSVKGEVTAKVEFGHMLEIRTTIVDEKDTVIVTGKARVQVRDE